MVVGGEGHAPAALPPTKWHGIYLQRRSGRVWLKIATIGIRSPDRPARKEQYPGPCEGQVRVLFNYN